jgi:hypothetical protein
VQSVGTVDELDDARTALRCGAGGWREPTSRVPLLDAERRAAALLRSAAPLRRALAAIAGRLVASRAWERVGFARLADYGRERAGLSARQIQELAHVDAALALLPRVEAKLVAGRLSWTKVRLLCRVATPDDEERWAAYAERVTARALAREVRAVDRGAVEEGALDGEEVPRGIRIRCAPRVNAKFHRARWLARRVAGEHLPSWACMEAVAAEALSALGLVPEEEAEGGCDEDRPGACWPLGDGDEAASVCAPPPRAHREAASGRAAPHQAANGCATQGGAGAHRPLAYGEAANGCVPLPRTEAANACATQGGAHVPWPPAVLELLSGLAEADAFELDARLRRAIALEQRIEAAAAPWLQAVADRGLYRLRGFASLEDWARERLGICPRKLRAILRLARIGDRCEALSEAFAAGRLSWVQAQVLGTLLLALPLPDQQAAWIEWAERVTVRRLETDVDSAILLSSADPATFAATAGLPEELEPLEWQTRAQPTAREGTPAGGEPAPETDVFFFVGPVEVVRLFRAVLCSVRRRLERATGRPASEGDAAEWMFDHALATWGATQPRVPREHAVFERDGWRCTAPGCTSYRNLHGHHVIFRSAGGSDELANRTTLCAFHHHRGVHAGAIRCRGEAPHGLRFELGLRPGRAPLLAYAPGEKLAR